MEEYLKKQLETINNQIELIKEQLVENIKWEEMVDATISFEKFKDLKSQGNLIKEILEKGDK